MSKSDHNFVTLVNGAKRALISRDASFTLEFHFVKMLKSEHDLKLNNNNNNFINSNINKMDHDGEYWFDEVFVFHSN